MRSVNILDGRPLDASRRAANQQCRQPTFAATADAGREITLCDLITVNVRQWRHLCPPINAGRGRPCPRHPATLP